MAIVVICAVAALVIGGIALRLFRRLARFRSISADLIGRRFRFSTSGKFRVPRHLFVWIRRRK